MVDARHKTSERARGGRDRLRRKRGPRGALASSPNYSSGCLFSPIYNPCEMCCGDASLGRLREATHVLQGAMR